MHLSIISDKSALSFIISVIVLDSNILKISLSKPIPYFNISPKAEYISSIGNVSKNSGYTRTSDGWLIVPIIFLYPLKFTPLFPPIAASTIANKVVGINLNFTPRIYVDAKYPTISVTIPPPIPIKVDALLAPISIALL